MISTVKSETLVTLNKDMRTKVYDNLSYSDLCVIAKVCKPLNAGVLDYIAWRLNGEIRKIVQFIQATHQLDKFKIQIKPELTTMSSFAKYHAAIFNYFTDELNRVDARLICLLKSKRPYCAIVLHYHLKKTGPNPQSNLCAKVLAELLEPRARDELERQKVEVSRTTRSNVLHLRSLTHSESEPIMPDLLVEPIARRTDPVNNLAQALLSTPKPEIDLSSIHRREVDLCYSPPIIDPKKIQALLRPHNSLGEFDLKMVRAELLKISEDPKEEPQAKKKSFCECVIL